MGHSWGTYLGMLVIARHPELYRAYVGIGQLARSSPIPGIQDEYISQSARRIGDQDAIKELEEKGSASVRETLLFKFGGEIHSAKSFMPLLLTGLAAPEYSLRDARNIPKGVSLYSFFNRPVAGLNGVIAADSMPWTFRWLTVALTLWCLTGIPSASRPRSTDELLHFRDSRQVQRRKAVVDHSFHCRFGVHID